MKSMRFSLLMVIVLAMCIGGYDIVDAQKKDNKDTSKAAVKLGVQTKETQTALSPERALQLLKEGNQRFVADKSRNQRLYRKQVPLTAKGQYPFAVILSCIDSRSSVEDIFDLNNGDAFNARIAGNVVTPDALGGFEFATKVMGAKLIVVLGHTKCGAIYGACDGVELGNLTPLLKEVEPAINNVDSSIQPRNSKNVKFVEMVTEENVRQAMKQIREDSPILRELIDSSKVAVVGGIYHLDSGRVEFLKSRVQQ